jgi:3-oxoacyl-[acyl-carrier protein] reductase
MKSNSELLSGKTAIITGCNRGIGKAILESFAANGANIFSCARKESKEFLEFTGQLAEKYSVSITPIYFDAANIDEIKSAVKRIASFKKPVDVLVNNAGIGHHALFQMTPLDKLKEVFDINFVAPFIFTQYIAKLMIRKRSGSIINISSTAGIDGNSGKSVYGSSKAALICMTKAIAAELGGFGIRSNSIAPGLTDTDMLSGMSKEIISGMLQTCDIKRVGKPSEVADTAVFLASDMASYITGQVIRVDGGLK